MKVKILRKNSSVPLPTYTTAGAVAFDLAADEDMVVPSGEVRLVPTGVVVSVPAGCMLMLAARSSTPLKRGLMLPNGIGVIDQDFCGPDDELKIQVYNFSKDPVEVKRGERIAQGIFVRMERAEWSEGERMPEENRGGFGSTGR